MLQIIRALRWAMAVAALAAPAAAGETPDGASAMLHETELSVGLGGARLRGDARRAGAVSYAGLLGAGTTGLLGLRNHFGLHEDERWALAAGPAFQFDHTTFRGSHDTDGDGRLIVADGLTMQRFLFGAFLRLSAGRESDPIRLWFEPQLLLGLARTSEVHIRSRTAPPILQLSDGTLFDDDLAFALDASIRIGLAFRITNDLELVLGGAFGVGWQERPAAGDSGLLPPDRADAMVPMYAAVSIALVVRRGPPRTPAGGAP